GKLRLPLVWFDGTLTGSAAWQHFAAALERHAMPTLVRDRFRVEQVELAETWPGYLATRSRNHRRQLRRGRIKAAAAGALELRVLDRLADADVETWLRRGFALEDAGWKGAAGTSVLKSPGVFEYYLRQARQLARWGQLQLVFLELDGRPIAFEYGWLGQGCYFSPKVAYDEACGQLSPGQLLRAALLERMIGEGTWQVVDFLGPSCRATREWSTSSYSVSRVIVATSLSGRAALAGYRLGRRLLAWVRKPAAPSPDDAVPDDAPSDSTLPDAPTGEPVPEPVGA
ncbi:MAG TPA: GNAT family N-acetyltransferase, partial [Pirellulales bacterium]|nr:GNAT family N-acetyltransferase [Pirellulales bacterium]